MNNLHTLPNELLYHIFHYCADLSAALHQISSIHPVLSQALEDQCAAAALVVPSDESEHNTSLSPYTSERQSDSIINPNGVPEWFMVCVIGIHRYDMSLIEFCMDRAVDDRYTLNLGRERDFGPTSSSTADCMSISGLTDRRKLFYWKFVCRLLQKQSYLSLFYWATSCDPFDRHYRTCFDSFRQKHDLERLLFRGTSLSAHLRNEQLFELKYPWYIDWVCEEDQPPVLYDNVSLHFKLWHVYRRGSKVYRARINLEETCRIQGLLVSIESLGKDCHRINIHLFKKTIIGSSHNTLNEKSTIVYTDSGAVNQLRSGDEESWNKSHNKIDVDFTSMSQKSVDHLLRIYPHMTTMMNNSGQRMTSFSDYLPREEFIQEMFGKRFKMKGVLYRIHYHHRMIIDIPFMPKNSSLLISTGKEAHTSFATTGDEIEVEGVFNDSTSIRTDKIQLVKPSFKPILSKEDIGVILVLTVIHIVCAMFGLQFNIVQFNYSMCGLILRTLIENFVYGLVLVLPIILILIVLSRVSSGRYMGLLFIPGSLTIDIIWHSLNLVSILKFLLFIWQFVFMTVIVHHISANIWFNKQKRRADPLWLDNTSTGAHSSHSNKHKIMRSAVSPG